MTDIPERRVYSADDVSRILARASALQTSQGERARSSSGLTLDEIRQIARESDIDPELVTAAAFEIVKGNDPAARNALGGPLKLTLRRHVRGKVGEESWRRMITAARQQFDTSGQTSEVGTTREWTGRTDSGSANFTLTEHGDDSEIEVFWSEGMLAIPFIVMPLVLSLIMLPVIFESAALGLAGIPVYLAAVALILGASRLVFGRAAKSRRRKIAAFADSLVAYADPEIGIATSLQAEKHVLSMDDAADQDTEASLRRRDRQRP